MIYSIRDKNALNFFFFSTSSLFILHWIIFFPLIFLHFFHFPFWSTTSTTSTSTKFQFFWSWFWKTKKKKKESKTLKKTYHFVACRGRMLTMEKCRLPRKEDYYICWKTNVSRPYSEKLSRRIKNERKKRMGKNYNFSK